MADEQISPPVDAPAAAAAAAPAVDDGMTAEGRTATALDAATSLRIENAKHLAKAENKLEEAAAVLSELLQAATERYGQLCPLLADLYFSYGDVLLRIAESKTEALEGAAAEEEDDEEEEAAPARSDGVLESKEDDAAPAAPAEEDLEKEEEDAQDDAQIAFENLDVARVIYTRMTQRMDEQQLALARVHLRLGDSLGESDKFEDAIAEYKACLAIRTALLRNDDRRIADVLSCIATAHIQLASTKDVVESKRKVHLSQALVTTQAAAECLCLLLLQTAESSGYVALATAAKAEIQADALKRRYPPGVTTSVVRGECDTSKSAEPEVKVFVSVYGANMPAADSSSSSTPDLLQELCEILDSLVQRMNDIQADLGISVADILREISDNAGATGSGSTGGATETIGWGSSAAASAAADAPASTLVARRKQAEAPASQSGGTPESTAAAAAASPALAGQKRRLEVDDAAGAAEKVPRMADDTPIA